MKNIITDKKLDKRIKKYTRKSVFYIIILLLYSIFIAVIYTQNKVIHIILLFIVLIFATTLFYSEYRFYCLKKTILNQDKLQKKKKELEG